MVVSLTTRVINLDDDNWNNLKHALRYIQFKILVPLILRIFPSRAGLKYFTFLGYVLLGLFNSTTCGTHFKYILNFADHDQINNYEKTTVTKAL